MSDLKVIVGLAREGWLRLREETHGPWSPAESRRARETFSLAGRWVGLTLVVAAAAFGVALAVRAGGGAGLQADPETDWDGDWEEGWDEGWDEDGEAAEADRGTGGEADSE